MQNILLVDDHDVVRDGVRRLFGDIAGSFAFGEAGSIPEAVRLVNTELWDLVILDLSLAGSSGLELLKQIKRIRPRLPVLIFTMHSEIQYARRAFSAGSAGYVTKETPRAELLKAIQKVLTGGRFVSPELAEALVLDLERGAEGPLHSLLSDREFEVMGLIASGKTVGQVAQLLTLSVKTVSTYRSRIMEKMSMKTNAEVTHYAIANGLVG